MKKSVITADRNYTLFLCHGTNVTHILPISLKTMIGLGSFLIGLCYQLNVNLS
jgi:hypothetical protein